MPNTERLEQDEQLEQPVKQTKRAYLLNTAVKLMIVVVAFITFYAIYLDGKIRAKMDGKTWELPAEVYARIESISIDDNLTLEQVKTALLDNGYRQVSQIATPGDFKIEDDTLVMLRSQKRLKHSGYFVCVLLKISCHILKIWCKVSWLKASVWTQN